MENASKALLMAAGVLIGLLILSLAVYLFVTFGATSAEIHKEIETNRLAEFNNQFTRYMEKEDITIYDVITIANLATDNNKYYQLSKRVNSSLRSDNYIKVIYDGRSIEFGIDNDNEEIINYYNEIIKNNLNNQNANRYNCEIEINKYTGKVWKVVFNNI